MQRFWYLFSPIQIGSMTVKNRIVTSTHATFLYNLKTALPNQREITYPFRIAEAIPRIKDLLKLFIGTGPSWSSS